MNDTPEALTLVRLDNPGPRHVRRVRAGGLLVIVAIMVAAGMRVGAQDRSVPVTGRAIPGFAALDRVVERTMQRYQVPGAALAVAREGRLVYARGYGYADREHRVVVQPGARFRIASISKPITAVAILRLVEERRLSLDARVFPLLRDLQPPRGAAVDSRLRDITVRHLLEHKGGWDQEQSFDPMFRPEIAARAVGAPTPASAETVVRYMMGQPLDFTPGTRSAYSNFGYCVLGRVIERVGGERYEDFVRREVLAPAGITRMRLGRSAVPGRLPGEVRYYAAPGAPLVRSVFPGVRDRVPEPDGGFYLEAMDAHGGWVATTVDLLRFLTAVTGARSPGILGSPPRGFVGYVPPVGRGYGWVFNGSLPGSNGTLRLDDGSAWAVLFNSRPGGESRFFEDLDAEMLKATRAIRVWPSGDLFDEFRDSS